MVSSMACLPSGGSCPGDGGWGTEGWIAGQVLREATLPSQSPGMAGPPVPIVYHSARKVGVVGRAPPPTEAGEARTHFN